MAGTKGLHLGRISNIAIQILSLPSQASDVISAFSGVVASVSQGVSIGSDKRDRKKSDYFGRIIDLAKMRASRPGATDRDSHFSNLRVCCTFVCRSENFAYLGGRKFLVSMYYLHGRFQPGPPVSCFIQSPHTCISFFFSNSRCVATTTLSRQ